MDCSLVKRSLLPALLSALILLLTNVPATAQVVVGQIDTFDGVSTDFWERGVNQDQRLVVTADGQGSSGRLVTFNLIQWSGDYLVAGVDSVRVTAQNLESQEPLVIRLAFGDQINPGSPSTWFSSLDAITLEPGQAATRAFPIDPTAFTRVQGAESFDQVMSDVRALRILHNPAPAAQGTFVVAVAAFDDIEALGGVPTAAPSLLPSLVLEPAFPNPFNPQTTLTFRIPASSSVELVVTDLRGRRVRTLVRDALPAGDHAVTWNGRGEAGRPLASGVYLAQLKVGGDLRSQSMTLLE